MIKDKIAKLIDVKSLVTLILTFVFSYLCVRSILIPETFKNVYIMIVGFYFGTQVAREKTK